MILCHNVSDMLMVSEAVLLIDTVNPFRIHSFPCRIYCLEIQCTYLKFQCLTISTYNVLLLRSGLILCLLEFCYNCQPSIDNLGEHCIIHMMLVFREESILLDSY